MRKIYFLFVVLMLMLLQTGSADSQNAPLSSFSGGGVQNRLVGKYEEMLRRALNPLFKDGSYLLTVKVAVNPEKIKQYEEMIRKGTAQVTDLPDIPVKLNEQDQRRFVAETMSEDELLQFTQQVSVRLVVDKKLPENAEQWLTRIVREIVDPESQRNDTIQVEKEDLNFRALTPAELVAQNKREEKSEKFQQKSILEQLQSFQILLAVALLGFSVVLGFAILGRYVKSMRPPEGTEGTASRRDLTMQQQMAAPPPPPLATVAQPGGSVSGGGSTERQYRGYVNEIASLVRKTPDHVTTVLKSFFYEERGLQMAALSMRALGVEIARLVAQRLPPQDMTRLSASVADLTSRAISQDDLFNAVREFHAAVMSYELSQALSVKENAQQLDWGFLGRLSDDEITTLLEGEDATLRALVFFHLPSMRASKIYGVLDEGVKQDTVAALFALEQQDDKEISPRLEKAYNKAQIILQKADRATFDSSGWMTTVGAKLSEQDRQLLIAGLENNMDAKRMAQIRTKLFSFADMVVLPQEILGMILQQKFNPAELSALMATLPEGAALSQKLFDAMPKQLREIVTDESGAQRQLMEQPHLRRRMLNQAKALRSRFEDAVKAMDANGDISLMDYYGGGSEEDLASVTQIYNNSETEVDGATNISDDEDKDNESHDLENNTEQKTEQKDEAA